MSKGRTCKIYIHTRMSIDKVGNGLFFVAAKLAGSQESCANGRYGKRTNLSDLAFLGRLNFSSLPMTCIIDKPPRSQVCWSSVMCRENRIIAAWT